MLRNFIYLISILALFSSCASHLPEFERAESLEQGEQRLAIGAFAGGFPNVDDLRMESTSYGVAVFHSIGISDNYNWSTLASIGGQNWYNEPSGLNLYSISTGPKYSFGSNEAITIPFTYTVFPNSDPLGDYGPDFFSPAFGVTPTYYMLTNILNNMDVSTFLRGELMVGKEGPIFGLTAGYRYDWSGAVYAKSFNINFGISGIYFGYAMDLLP